MNLKKEQMEAFGLSQVFDLQEWYLKRVFGSSESLIADDTYQFDDYAKYEVTAFDEREKAKARRKRFPKSCAQAFAMGARFAAAHA